MNIAYATDENFVPITAVSMVSLFVSNKDADKIEVYILEDRITDQSKTRLLDIADKYGRGVSFISVVDMEKSISMEMIADRGSSFTQFARLFLPQFLPEEKKILYMDADTIILESLSPLYKCEFEDNEVLAGIKDCVGAKHKQNIGLKKDEFYINSGVILFDLEKMRKRNTVQLFINFIERHAGQKIPYADQGILNATLKGQIKTLPLKYNTVSMIYAETYENMIKLKNAQAFYTKEESIEAKLDPAIVHFTSCFLMERPWVENSTHPYVRKWREYCEKTSWAGYAKKSDQSTAKKTYIRIYKILPGAMAVKITSFLYDSVKAYANRLR